MDTQNLSQQEFTTWANAHVLERKLHLSESFIGLRHGGAIDWYSSSWDNSQDDEEEVEIDLLEFYGC
jgi:hypothetical protein